MIVTREMLAELFACDYQRDLFTKTFGEGAEVEVSEENLLRAAEAGLEIEWWFEQTVPRKMVHHYLERISALLETKLEHEEWVSALMDERHEQVFALRKRCSQQVALLKKGKLFLGRRNKQRVSALLDECERLESVLWDDFSHRVDGVLGDYYSMLVPIMWSLLTADPKTLIDDDESGNELDD